MCEENTSDSAVVAGLVFAAYFSHLEGGLVRFTEVSPDHDNGNDGHYLYVRVASCPVYRLDASFT